MGQFRLSPIFSLGHCLMSNHVHLIAVPHTETALAQCLKQAHGRYAAYWNGQRSSTGHVWCYLVAAFNTTVLRSSAAMRR